VDAFVLKISENFKNFWNSLAAERKAGLVLLTILVGFCCFAVVKWATHTTYQPLYSELNKEDGKQIARLLEESNIPYQFENNGKSILVPEDKVHIWRLELAKKGVEFSGTVGYEVFDKQSFGTTSFVQKINRQRAIEGELVKTIKHLKGVKRARVHLSIPEQSPFVSEQKPPSASIVLELDRGVSMTLQEIKGVASLVASSVDGMRPENVTIIDARGKKLSENIGDPVTRETSNRLALQTRVNRQMEDQIENILAKVVGAGKVIAKVNTELDFTQAVTTETKFDGENSTVLSEVTNDQIIKGSRPSPQGIPGARSNLPGENPQPGIPETRNNVDKKLKTRNYNVPSKVTKSTHPTARIKNLTVAVMIDGKQVTMFDKAGAVILDEDGIPKTQYQAWGEADITNFNEIIASTVGINLKRGDKLTIRNMEFAKEDLALMDAIMRKRENRKILKNIIKYLVIGLILTMFFFIVVRPFIQWVTENTVESVEDFLPKTLEELEKIQSDQKLPGLEDALPTIEEKLNPEKVEGNMLKEKIITLIENNPEKAAQVMAEMIHSVDSDKEIA
jgi:flagellar M-ring protein FliF